MPEEDKDQTPADDGAKPDDDGMTTDAGRRALKAERARAAELQKQIDALKPLADAAKKAEDDQKTEVQRLTEKVAELEKNHAATTAERDKLQVAIAKGLTKAQTKRLMGSTVEELEADADEILAEWGAKSDDTPAGPPPGGRPKEALKSGGAESAPAGEQSLDKLAELFDS